MKKKQPLNLTECQRSALERSLVRGIKTGETEITLRSVKGTIRINLAFPESVVAARFATRQQLRAARDRDVEDMQLIWCREERVKPSKLRALAEHKLKSARAFRQGLDRKVKQSYQLLEDRINLFICANWDQLKTIPNPFQLPGLRAWWPSLRWS